MPYAQCSHFILLWLYWKENVNGWSESSVRNYKGVYNSLFEIMAVTADIPFEEIEFYHLDNDFIDDFVLNLQLLPTQFSKKFAGKLTMKETLKYVKKLKEGDDIAGLDAITKKNLIDTMSVKTLNEKYILKMNNFLDYAVRTGKMEKNWLSGRDIKTKDEIVSYRVYSDEELKIIFSDKMFAEKICYKDEYSRYWLPILALYSGARINEIAQLRNCDFQKEKDIFYIYITKSEHTSVKTKSSIRKIPLHPNLDLSNIMNGFVIKIKFFYFQNFMDLINLNRVKKLAERLQCF